ncbi:MAG TPA: hypothetical protein VFV72_11885 [Candidatus Limnocylindrales bacterium]|nr:hypothetical protein [Candidatus Limnocylindrales bacterium]
MVVGAGGTDDSFMLALGALMVVSAAVGSTIVWRRPDNRVGLLLVVGAVMLASVAIPWPLLVITNGPEPLGPLGTILAWWSPLGLLPAVFVLFPTVVLYFPDGRPPGRRWGRAHLAVAAVLVVGISLQAIAPWPFKPIDGRFGNPFEIPGVPADFLALGEGIAVVAVLAGLIFALASVAVRFRQSRALERAQIKWLLAAVALNCVFFPLSYATSVEPQAAFDVVSVVVACLTPIAIGIAVLRYRLYEIDRLISRSVSWAIVTGVLVTTFAVIVVGLQAPLSKVTQADSLAVAASTLAVLALFQPVRRRVQRLVDRRFDRARYDSDRTAEAFSTRIRSEVDLDAVADDLTGSVGRVLRPQAMSLWLKGSSR